MYIVLYVISTAHQHVNPFSNSTDNVSKRAYFLIGS